MNRILCLTLVASLIIGCSSGTTPDCFSSDASTVRDSCLISAETAGAIAKGYMCLDYDVKEYEVEVRDAGDKYEVHLKRIAGENKGSGPILFLRKSDGERIYTVHSK